MQQTVIIESAAVPEAFPMLRDKTASGTGWQVYEPDLKAASCDEQRITRLQMRIAEGTDPAPYVEKMKHIYDSFLEKTGSPLHYFFTVEQETERFPYQMLWQEAAIFGEKYSMDDLPKEDQNFAAFSESVLERLFEKHGITAKE